MFQDLTVAVVVPAFNEERAIARTVRSVPPLVDHVVVVDDASSDRTSDRLTRMARDAGPACSIVRHATNRGVGAAIVTGYRWVLAADFDVAVVMAGDGQMDPDDLPALLAPIAAGLADYTKGNRFLHRDVWRAMPASRLVGNLVLSTATKVTSGYWRVFDSQCGYTAITRSALEAIDLDRVFSRYGYPNDVLARLHASGMRVADVPVRPVYGPHWKSGIKVRTVVYPVAYVLLRSWATRLAVETRNRWRDALPQPGDEAPG